MDLSLLFLFSKEAIKRNLILVVPLQQKLHKLYFLQKLCCQKICWDQQPLTRVSIPQHEPSEARGGPGSWHHNGSGFTIATVGPGLLLLLIMPLPYTRQLSHGGSGPGSVTPIWAEWLPLLVSRSRGCSYFTVNQLI